MGKACRKLCNSRQVCAYGITECTNVTTVENIAIALIDNGVSICELGFVFMPVSVVER
jgi:tryptophan synthase alpha subunit